MKDFVVTHKEILDLNLKRYLKFEDKIKSASLISINMLLTYPKDGYEHTNVKKPEDTP